MTRIFRVLLVLGLLVPILIASQPAAGEAAACGQPATPEGTPASGTPAATTDQGPGVQRIGPEGGSALLWPGGDRGVLLLHGAAYDAASWDAQARTMASQGYTVLALEDLSTGSVQDGIAYLVDACATRGVTVIGASAGGSAALTALADGADDVSGLVLLSATGDVDALGPYPKLFVASEGEGLADQVEEMAAGAPGDQNDTLILPGSAHAQATFATDQGPVLIDAILAFLDDTATWGGSTRLERKG